MLLQTYYILKSDILPQRKVSKQGLQTNNFLHLHNNSPSPTWTCPKSIMNKVRACLQISLLKLSELSKSINFSFLWTCPKSVMNKVSDCLQMSFLILSEFK